MSERCAVYLCRKREGVDGLLCLGHAVAWRSHPLYREWQSTKNWTGEAFLRWLDLQKAIVEDAWALRKAVNR